MYYLFTFETSRECFSDEKSAEKLVNNYSGMDYLIQEYKNNEWGVDRWEFYLGSNDLLSLEQVVSGLITNPDVRPVRGSDIFYNIKLLNKKPADLQQAFLDSKF